MAGPAVRGGADLVEEEECRTDYVCVCGARLPWISVDCTDPVTASYLRSFVSVLLPQTCCEGGPVR